VRFVFSWIVLFAIWMALTSSLQIQEVLTGVITAGIVASFTWKNFTTKGLRYLHPKRIFYILLYILVFLKELVKSNFHVAWIVIHPKLPISPGIVRFPTKLKSETAKLILANSITLTPGTLSVDIKDNMYYIHWLEAQNMTDEEAAQNIAGPFENLLIKIFED